MGDTLLTPIKENSEVKSKINTAKLITIVFILVWFIIVIYSFHTAQKECLYLLIYHFLFIICIIPSVSHLLFMPIVHESIDLSSTLKKIKSKQNLEIDRSFIEGPIPVKSIGLGIFIYILLFVLLVINILSIKKIRNISKIIAYILMILFIPLAWLLKIYFIYLPIIITVIVVILAKFFKENTSNNKKLVSYINTNLRQMGI